MKPVARVRMSRAAVYSTPTRPSRSGRRCLRRTLLEQRQLRIWIGHYVPPRIMTVSPSILLLHGFHLTDLLK